jgi:leucyl aminopeptidase (aminopeptidase T)
MTEAAIGAAYPASYEEGARNAVFTCLGVRDGETCVLIADEENREIAAALARQFEAAGARLQSFVLEELSSRPLERLPEPIGRALEGASVSCFVASAKTGELPVRMEMTAIVNRRRIRHAHMVNMAPRIMLEGMRADFRKVDALSRWVLERVRGARTMRCTSSAGSDITVTLDPKLAWIKTSGLISPEKWGNLPGGEVFTSPGNVEGIFVCDGVLGDWLAAKYGDMRENPLTVTIERSRIVDLACPRADVLADLRAYTTRHENGNRVGEFALGTNIALRDVIGQILQDEKIPGVHIAFGHPYAEHTGADWTATTHIDVVGRDFDVLVDGVPIMRKSRYLVDVDALP